MPSEGRATALALGYGGLIPFVALSLAIILGVDLGEFSGTGLLAGYAATILSFLGAIHWGIAVATPDHNSPRDFVASVIPPLFAWVALSLPAPQDLLAFGVAFPAWYLWERVSMLDRYPAWFRRLRAALTLVVSITLACVVAFG